MFTISDILERYQGRQVLKSVAGYLTRSVERTSELVDDLHQTAQERSGNQRGKRDAHDQNADKATELPFPDRRQRNIPVLLDTRSKRNHPKNEQMPMIDITV